MLARGSNVPMAETGADASSGIGGFERDRYRREQRLERRREAFVPSSSQATTRPDVQARLGLRSGGRSSDMSGQFLLEPMRVWDGERQCSCGVHGSASTRHRGHTPPGVSQLLQLRGCSDSGLPQRQVSGLAGPSYRSHQSVTNPPQGYCSRADLAPFHDVSTASTIGASPCRRRLRRKARPWSRPFRRRLCVTGSSARRGEPGSMRPETCTSFVTRSARTWPCAARRPRPFRSSPATST